MRVLFFHRWVGVHDGGTETHIKALANHLAQKGHDVGILTVAGERLGDFHPKIIIHTIGRSWGEAPFSYGSMYDPRLYLYTVLFMVKSLVRLVVLWTKGERYDIISVHFITESKVARVIRSLFKVPYVFVLEGYTDWEGREAKHANLQVALSQHEVDECYKNYAYKPLVIPLGIDSRRFNVAVDRSDIRRKYGDSANRFVLTVCRLEPRKDIPTLLEAAQIVSGENPEVKFIIVGEGVQERELRKMVNNMNLSKTVIFAGRVSGEELPKYYRACDVFALPTLYEGFGIVYLEAMACGLPIVSTSVGAVPEVVGDCGILMSPRNAELLAAKILQLLEDNELRQEFVLRGLRRVEQHYDSAKLLDLFERACYSVIRGDRVREGEHV